MSDITQILQLKGARLESIETGDDAVTLHFSEIRLVQEMEGAFEDSLWTQAIRLTVKDPETSGERPQCPCVISGGELTDNIYTYRGHAPLPIRWRGDTGCRLEVADGGEFGLSGSALEVEQIDTPRYLRHIGKDAAFE